jgi:hypothetical protein
VASIWPPETAYEASSSMNRRPSALTWTRETGGEPGLPVVVADELGRRQHQAPAVAGDRGVDLLAEREVVAARAGGGDDEQRVAGAQGLGEPAAHELAVLREAARGDHDRAGGELDAVGDDAGDPGRAVDLAGQQALHAGVQDRLDTERLARLVEHLHQAVALVLRDVRAPDVLDAGAGEPGHVRAGRDLRGHLEAEADHPLERRGGELGEAADQAGLEQPLVEVHVVLVEPLGRVLDAERLLHGGAGGGEHAGRELGRAAELALGLEQHDGLAGLGRGDGGCEARSAAAMTMTS